jgi:hypothetical protein
VDGFNSLLVRSANEASSMQFNWVAGPATTQGEFFKGAHQPLHCLCPLLYAFIHTLLIHTIHHGSSCAGSS